MEPGGVRGQWQVPEGEGENLEPLATCLLILRVQNGKVRHVIYGATFDLQRMVQWDFIVFPLCFLFSIRKVSVHTCHLHVFKYCLQTPSVVPAWKQPVLQGSCPGEPSAGVGEFTAVCWTCAARFAYVSEFLPRNLREQLQPCISLCGAFK